MRVLYDIEFIISTKLINTDLSGSLPQRAQRKHTSGWAGTAQATQRRGINLRTF